VAFPHGHLVQPHSPPPDFDPDLITIHLRRIARRDPSFLGFAHFGPHRDPQPALQEAESRLWDWVRWMEAAAGSDEELAAGLRAWALDGYRAEGIPETVIATYDRNADWSMYVPGMRRWLQQR
jgi:hypothetical protein